LNLGAALCYPLVPLGPSHPPASTRAHCPLSSGASLHPKLHLPLLSSLLLALLPPPPNLLVRSPSSQLLASCSLQAAIRVGLCSLNSSSSRLGWEFRALRSTPSVQWYPFSVRLSAHCFHRRRIVSAPNRRFTCLSTRINFLPGKTSRTSDLTRQRLRYRSIGGRIAKEHTH
jgi:hypothetical protein